MPVRFDDSASLGASREGEKSADRQVAIEDELRARIAELEQELERVKDTHKPSSGDELNGGHDAEDHDDAVDSRSSNERMLDEVRCCVLSATTVVAKHITVANDSGSRGTFTKNWQEAVSSLDRVVCEAQATRVKSDELLSRLHSELVKVVCWFDFGVRNSKLSTQDYHVVSSRRQQWSAMARRCAKYTFTARHSSPATRNAVRSVSPIVRRPSASSASQQPSQVSRKSSVERRPSTERRPPPSGLASRTSSVSTPTRVASPVAAQRRASPTSRDRAGLLPPSSRMAGSRSASLTGSALSTPRALPPPKTTKALASPQVEGVRRTVRADPAANTSGAARPSTPTSSSSSRTLPRPGLRGASPHEFRKEVLGHRHPGSSAFKPS